MTLVDAGVILLIFSLTGGTLGCLWSALSEKEEQAAQKETRIQLRKVATQLELYKQQHASKLPDQLSEILVEGFNELPKDGWGEDFVYQKLNDTEHKLLSKGPDKRENTEDDIKSRWSR